MTNEFWSASDDPGAAAVAAWIAELETGGQQSNPRAVDTASLLDEFPRLRGVATTDLVVPGSRGDLPARLYLPPDVPRCALVWVHGGAYIAGDLDDPSANWVAYELAARSVLVVSVEYHHALRGVDGAVLIDDVLAQWASAVAVAARHGVDAERVHLGGGSAGATLATAAALRLRDAGEALPRTLVLVQGLFHPALPPIGPEIEAALAGLAPEYVFTPAAIRAITSNYAGPTPTPYAFPALCRLAGLPPALLLNAERDTIRASGEDFALRLEAAGVSTTVVCEPDVTHGHLEYPGDAGALATIDRMAGWLLA